MALRMMRCRILTLSLLFQHRQDNMRKLVLRFQVEDPNNPGEYLIDSQDTIYDYRHELSDYEAECRFANKDC